MELRPDVSLVIVVDDNEKLLVIKRSKQSTDTGRWESPVGHRDSGETAEEAALREVKEETGLKVTLFPESFQKTNPDGKKIQVFMARAKTTEVKLEPKEHDEFKWLTLKEVQDLTPTHPSYKADVSKVIKLNSDKQKEKKAMLGRGYMPPQLRNNNYMATYPLGASMPKKPNPAAQVKPVQPVKADAAGIQQAMAKRAWEVDDDSGLYSNKPLMYASYLTAPPSVSRNSPDWENEFVDKTLQQASKKLPDNRQLHWIDFDAITGNRSWYNPMRYLAGKEIIGEKNYVLGRDNDNNARSEIVKQILMNNNLLSHYPAKYLDEDMSKEKNMAKRAARCWEGYEPVPGKEPYSNDSCRPKGSKKKKQKTANYNTSVTRNSLPFTLGGAVLGGLGGAAYNKLRGDDEERPMWRDVLTGAGAGAGAGFASNLAGNATYDNNIGLQAGLGLKGDRMVALLAALGGGVGGGIAGGGLVEGGVTEALTGDVDKEEKEAMAKRGAVKLARNLNLRDIPSGSGPQQMANAMNMFNQAKALANVEGTRRQHGLSQTGLNRVLSQLEGAEGEDYDFDQYRSNPKANAAWSGIAGAGLGGLAGYMGAGIPGALGGAALGGAGGAGYGYLNAARKNQELMQTAKLLRDYGLLTPEHLRQAMPLLKASEDKKPKMKDKDFSTGADALDSLKEHMRKKGFDEFQTNFFSRLVSSGLNLEQIKVAVAKVESFDKEAADSLKSGFEKLANGFLRGAFGAAKNYLTKSLPKTTSTLNTAANGAFNAAKPAMNAAHILPNMNNATNAVKDVLPSIGGRAATGALSGALNPLAPDASEIVSNPLGYAGKVAPYMLYGAGLGAAGGKQVNQAMLRANAGSAAGGTLGMLSDGFLGTNGMAKNLSNVGFTGGFLSRGVSPNAVSKLDPTTWISGAAKRLYNNPNLAAGGLVAAGGTAAGLGGLAAANSASNLDPKNPQNQAALQGMIGDAIKNNPEINNTMSAVKDTANSWNASNVLGGMGDKINGGAGGLLGSLGLGNLGETFKENPWLLPMLLTGLAGGAGGYAMGGRGGAALGGIGLPLIMYLLSQQNKGGSNVAPPLNRPPASAAAAPTIPQQNAKYSPTIKPDGAYVPAENAPDFGGPADTRYKGPMARSAY